jgi:hypothetical protein
MGVEAAAVVRHLDAELLSSQSRVDADMARARMAASVDERLADDAEDFCPPPPQRTGRHSVCDVQKDLAIDGRLPVDFDERGEELSEWPVLLAAQPAARRSRPATAGPPSKQRPHPSQPLRCLWVSQIRARTSCLGQASVKFWSASSWRSRADSLSLVFSNLDQTLLGLCARHRRGDHVRHTLKEVEVVRGYVVWRSPARRR